MSAIAELGDIIAAFKPEEAKELRTWFKDKYDIEAPGGNFIPPPKLEIVKVEPTEFNVIYEGFVPEKKMSVIKTVREITNLGLGEAKAFAEGTPKAIKETLDKKAAEDLLKKLLDAGAKASIQPVQ